MRSLIRNTLVLALAVGFGFGCDDEPADPTAPDGGMAEPTADSLPLQPTRRFALGATFYLPGDGWSLAGAPAGNANALYVGADGYTRFTPVIAGDYVFERGDETRDLTVVADVPYAHYNYYPTTSVAGVGDQVWVAHVFDPHITRLDAEGAVIDTIPVGPWPVSIAHRAGMSHALVAHKAGDTVGFVDVESGRLEDALWVGDEPAQVVLSPDGTRAWVSLNSQDAVALIDVEARALVATLETNLAPQAMALSEDGGRLFVASYRSGVSDRLQFGTDERYDAFDIAVVDTAEQTVVDYIEAVGSNLNGLYVDGDRLYVAMTRSVVSVYSGQEGMTAFRHTVAAYDLSADGYPEVAAADIGRQESAPAIAVRPYGLTRAGTILWVAVEGSDVVVGLDPDSLAEIARYEVPGRPRSIAAVGDRVFTHGLQAYSVTRADANGAVLGATALEGDPRSRSLALGQRLYTGSGGGPAEHHSCADCHIDGLTDGNVWSAGGFSESASRPMFWMEGTDPIGWEGDAFELFSYLYGSPGPTIGVIISTETHRAFYDYLAAFVPPPPANGFTARDGSMTPAGIDGRDAFVSGGCAGCHGGPLTTTGLRLPGGGTQDAHPIVVPSLVGAYRHGSWLVNGAARTLLESVVAMEPLSGQTLDDTTRERIVRYLRELTAREFFVLKSTPAAGAEAASADAPLTLIFSHAVWNDAQNLARIRLLDADDAPVEATLTADNRQVTIQPAAPLAAGGAYTIEVGADFEAFSETAIVAANRIGFTVAAPEALRLEGEYEIHIDHPNLDFPNRRYDPEVIIPVMVPAAATATASGATFELTVTDILDSVVAVTIDGETAYWPPFPFPVGPPGFLNRSFPTTMALVDEDGDGVADSGESTLMLRSPGLEAEGVVWRLQRPQEEPATCDTASGDHPVDLEFGDGGLPTASWQAAVNALGYFVTSPEATTPLGPGPVTGGETYWALSTMAFPDGFAGPIAYGEVPEGATDVSEDSGAMAGGSPIPDGACVKVTVVFNDFSTSEVRYVQGAQ